MNSDLIVGAQAAARYTGLSRRAVYRLVERGLIPTIRMGRRLYFRKSELDRAFSSPQNTEAAADKNMSPASTKR